MSAGAVAAPMRPDALAYPSPTTVRFVMLVIATLISGVFVGSWVDSVLYGAQWRQQALACIEGLPAVPDARNGFDQWSAYDLCNAASSRRRVLFGAAAITVNIVGAAVALYLSPVLLRRRRRLRPAAPRLAAAADRFEQLARAAGLNRPPTLMVGSAAQLDAFSYGTPGRYRVVLPLGAAIRPDSPAFRALAAHELAHVARRDVTVAWLARSVGYAVLPTLLLPLLLAPVAGHYDGLLDYSWRALVLGAVIVVVRAGILRSREFDADLFAARRSAGVEALATLLASARPGPRRGILAKHPDPATRIRVLHQPALVSRLGFTDALAAAFLAALTPPLIEMIGVPALAGTGRLSLAPVLASAVTGALLGGTVGIALWRAALLHRVGGPPVRLVPVAAGILLGVLLGDVASLAGFGAGLFDQASNPVTPVVAGVATAAATITVAGLGELWAGAAGRLPSAGVSWIAAVVLSGALYAVVWWAAGLVRLMLRFADASAVRMTVLFGLNTVPMLVVTVVLAVAAGWALWTARQPQPPPPWLLESGSLPPAPPLASPGPWSTVAVGAGAGLAAVAVMVAFRLIAGPAVSDAVALQRAYAYFCVAAAAAAAAALVLAVLTPGRGAGAALLAAPIAAAVAMLGFIVWNTVLGGRPTLVFVTTVLRGPVGMALMAELLAVGAVLLPPTGHRRSAVLLTTVAAGAAALAGAVVIAARELIIPLAEVW